MVLFLAVTLLCTLLVTGVICLVMKPWPMYHPPLVPGWALKQYYDLMRSELRKMDEWRSPWEGLIER